MQGRKEETERRAGWSPPSPPPHHPLGVSLYTSLWWHVFGAPRGSAPMVRYYDLQLRSSLCSLLTRRAFGIPKDNGVDASIDIFLVASLEYHLM